MGQPAVLLGTFDECIGRPKGGQDEGGHLLLPEQRRPGREDGNARLDHKRRGVMCGTHWEGDAFLRKCRGLGLRVQQSGFFVPFSNGQRRNGTFTAGAPFADYLEGELCLARYDLPDEETLAECIARYARPESAPSW